MFFPQHRQVELKASFTLYLRMRAICTSRYTQVHTVISSKADFLCFWVAILIFRYTFESWYSMLFFRFSTTKRQSGLSTHQVSQDQALQRWCWRLARRRWTVSVCPVSTEHTESHGPECLLVVLLGASGAGLQPARTGPAGHAGGF